MEFALISNIHCDIPGITMTKIHHNSRQQTHIVEALAIYFKIENTQAIIKILYTKSILLLIHSKERVEHYILPT